MLHCGEVSHTHTHDLTALMEFHTYLSDYTRPNGIFHCQVLFVHSKLPWNVSSHATIIRAYLTYQWLPWVL